MCHVMLDLETLGKTAGCAIASIGACVFDLDGIHDKFLFEIDIATTPLKIEPETLAWWLKQDDAAIKATFGNPKGPHARALNDFANWYRDEKAEHIWAHGASFDIPILEAAYQFEHLIPPWSYRAVRDTRTIFAMSGEAPEKSVGIYHHALDDAITQAEAIIRSYKKIGFFY